MSRAVNPVSLFNQLKPALTKYRILSHHNTFQFAGYFQYRAESVDSYIVTKMADSWP